ncbi:ATP-dependent RNA helicase DDX19A [Trichonephila clavipes]|nr:ATP-dependent RNA helicase DDX19A [Trichonephila clavipes]
MSRWDKCCRSGTFNKNFGSNKISGERSSRNEVFLLREPEASAQSSISTFDTDNYAVEETDFCNEVSFSDMQFHVKFLKAINEACFYHPRKTQKEILSSLFERLYRCYVICAPDKSGKTSAILLWVLNELLRDETKEYPKALMVCPTHEIAESTYLFAEKIAKFCEVKVTLRFGSFPPQFREMTPCRLSGASHLSPPSTNLTKGLATRWLFRAPPCRKGTIPLQAQNSVGFYSCGLAMPANILAAKMHSPFEKTKDL